ncbi:hypothetical protein MGG_16658 [Pyricularia oryzae 70-15]|uniref:Uncharacterized protein n=1 Tax=Pyricularia oryzae (strain 70-15 / ATCC MYA-4617 / FGSC 8958) TaxID=242507 RepID=G4N268_PYRO7|nr:uncharacterized protein MGG_16658 [Pyricularia oryzae 70-15]EHA51684.1 hypothetical protein MGG_16658 [Pyricularia oryzae 70-15]
MASNHNRVRLNNNRHQRKLLLLRSADLRRGADERAPGATRPKHHGQARLEAREQSRLEEVARLVPYEVVVEVVECAEDGDDYAAGERATGCQCAVRKQGVFGDWSGLQSKATKRT